MATWEDLFATDSIDEDLISLKELLEINKNKTESLLKIKGKKKKTSRDISDKDLSVPPHSSGSLQCY